MIDEFSTNIKLNGQYGTWETVCRIEHEGNLGFILQSEETYYESCRIIVDENKRILVEDGRNMSDFVKYLEDLEFYYGGSLRRR